jgi:hypothetical protein
MVSCGGTGQVLSSGRWLGRSRATNKRQQGEVVFDGGSEAFGIGNDAID